MNKVILSLLIVSQIFIVSQAQAPSNTANAGSSNLTCSSHAIFNKASQLLTDILQQDSKGSSILNSIKKTFQSANATSKTAGTLGVCAGYASQNSCCDQNYVNLVDQAALLKVKPILQAKSIFQKFINVYIQQVNKNCTQNVLPTTPLSANAILGNATLKVLQSNKTTQAQCRIKFAKAISSYTRGALCTACLGVDKVSTFLTAQNQLKISKASVQAFQTATDEAITCYQKIFFPQNIELITNELNAAYLKGNDKCGQNVTLNMKTIFQNPQLNNFDGFGNKMCNGTSIFGNNAGCENILQGDPTIEQKNVRLLLNEEQQIMKRMLQITPDAVIDPAGLDIYIVSKTDDSITEDGSNIRADYTAITVKTYQGILFLSYVLLIMLFVF